MNAIPDRAYSLDSTDPVDYEPEEQLDWRYATLTDIADHFKTDKGQLKHNYTRIYENYLWLLRDQPDVRLLEIGVACGASLKTWARYLDAKIIGVDIRESCKYVCSLYPNIEIRIADATKQSQPETFDVIIDDGSHVSQDIVDAFNINWPSLKSGGHYFIEDLKCTHNDAYPDLISFQIDPKRFSRNHFTSFLDEKLKQMDWGNTDIEFIHFYRELAVIKKS